MDDLNTLSDLDIWSILAGFGMPLLIAFISSARWPGWARALVAVAVCIAGGTMTALLTGYYGGVPMLRAVLVTLIAALGFYRVWWKPSGIAPAIEAKTTPRLPWWYTPAGPRDSGDAKTGMR